LKRENPSLKVDNLKYFFETLIVRNYKLLRDLLIERAHELNELAYALDNSRKALKKLKYVERRNHLIKIALAMFAFPEPVVTDIIGAILLLLSFKGIRRIDERVMEEFFIIKYRMRTAF